MVCVLEASRNGSWKEEQMDLIGLQGPLEGTSYLTGPRTLSRDP